MATPPTYVTEYETSWSVTTTPKTQSVTTNVDDVLVVIASSHQSQTFTGPSGGTGLTWTKKQEVSFSGFQRVTVWTATATTAETFTLSLSTSSSSFEWGFSCLRFSGSAGVSASGQAHVDPGAPSLAITTTGANSAIVVCSADWNGASGASRAWRTPSGSTAITETTYNYLSGKYTVYGGYHSDAGAAGSKTVGLTAPTGQAYSIVAVEVLGTTFATLSGAAAMAAVSSLGAGAALPAAAATLAASSGLTAGARLPAAAATMTATSALGAGAGVPPSAVVLAAVGALATSLTYIEQAAAVLAGVTTLSGVSTPPTTMAATSMLITSGLLLPGVAATGLAASSALQVIGFGFLPVTALLAGSSDLTSTLFTTWPGAVQLIGRAALVSNTALPGASAAMTATSTLTADIYLITGGTGVYMQVTSTLLATATSYTPALVLPGGPVYHPVRTPAYRLYAADTRTGRVGWELPYTALQWSNPINDAGQLRATLVIEDALDAVRDQGALDPRNILREVLTGPFRFSLALAWGNNVVFAGPYLPATDPGDTPTVDVGAAELVRIFDKRLMIDEENGFSDIVFGPTSNANLIKNIIDKSTDGYGRELPITCSNPPNATGPYTLVYHWWDLAKTADALTNLTSQEDGPDYRLDPYFYIGADGLYLAWELHVGEPNLGASQSPWTFDDTNAVVSRDIDAMRMASTFYVPGSGQDEKKTTAYAVNTTLIERGFPALEDIDGGYSSETDITRLISYANADVSRYLAPVDKWTLKVRADAEPGLGTYRVGDAMLVDIRRHPIIAPGTYTRRITEISGDHTPWVSLGSTEPIGT